MIDSSTTLRPRDDVRFRLVGTECVIIRQDADEVLGLNEVGSRLFALIASGKPIDGAIDVLVAEFDVERETLADDVTAFLQALVAAGVIEIIPAAQP